MKRRTRSGNFLAERRVARLFLTAIHIALLLLILATTGIGCAHLGVEPWDRDLLAEPAMQLDSDPIETGLDEHIYFSKEASSGGQGFGGGGCGCN